MRTHASVLHLVQLLVLLLAVQLDAFALSPPARVNGGGQPSNQAASLNGRDKPAAASSSWRAAAHPAISPELRSKAPLTVQTMSGGGEGGQVGSTTCDCSRNGFAEVYRLRHRFVIFSRFRRRNSTQYKA